MKKILASIIALPLLTSVAMADTVVLPRECIEPVSSEFSTGNGDSAFFQIEVMCKTGEGRWTIFTAEKGSVAGFFGMGRISQPTNIDIVIGDHSGKAIWK